MSRNTGIIIYGIAVLIFTAYLMTTISAWWFIGGLILLSAISE